MEYPEAIDTIPPVPGDLNGDALVNGADLSILLGNWNTDHAPSDLDGSGLVDGADLARLLSNWKSE